MNPVGNGHGKKHKRGIEHVDVRFVLKQVSIIPLRVFHHTEGRSNEDQNTDGIQRNQMLLPRRRGRERRGPHGQVAVEEDGGEEEEGEEDDLDAQAGEDDVLGQGDIIRTLGASHDAAT